MENTHRRTSCWIAREISTALPRALVRSVLVRFTGSGRKAGRALLHSFDSSDGYIPNGALVRDSSGNLYGTTQSGGPSGYGTVFMLKP
jgi:uncharacterized repeat protein (TIGR03803 family)